MATAMEQIFIDTIKKTTEVGGEIYDGIKVVGAKAIDLAQKEIPDIIHQLLVWKMTEAVISTICCLLVVICMFVLIIKFYKHDYSRNSDMAFFRGFASLIMLVVALIFLCFTYSNAMTAVKIYVAPKIFLIEYANQLLTSSTNMNKNANTKP